MITHFSDSIVISCLADHRAKDNVEWALNGIIDGLLMTGFVLRGGVTHGLLIHRESLVYGPALIRAYELESKQAAMPRVILDHPIAAAWGAGVRVQTRDGALLGYRRTWRQDRDGWFFFDFMADRFWMPGTDKDTTKPQFEWQMGRWRELILKGLSAHSSNAAVFRKYDWLREYFNAVCAENAFDEVAAIPPVAPE
jgi:hypothetical protein